VFWIASCARCPVVRALTEEGETTLDAPLAAYRVEDGEVLPAR
jgi:hypothetical protein